LTLLIVSGAIVIGRHPTVPFSEELRNHISLHNLSSAAANQALHVLMIPIGSVIVVFVRLTLGLQMLGPFRPILIAIALRVTGLPTGALLVLLAMTTVLLVRPRLRGHGIPYFGRLSVLLVAVVLVVVTTLLVGQAFRFETLERVAFFPIVVLMLTADGVARVVARDGVTSAVWRGGVTLLIALAINLVFRIPGLPEMLLKYPELVLFELALILLIAGWLKLRLLQSLNPGAPFPRGEDYFNNSQEELTAASRDRES
jgi:hypothetical protein